MGFWGLWNISFGFFGIQIGFALQNANMSRIFQTLGTEIDNLPALWVAAPLTGLLVQPIIGHMSDKSWLGRLGRRRPYFPPRGPPPPPAGGPAPPPDHRPHDRQDLARPPRPPPPLFPRRGAARGAVALP